MKTILSPMFRRAAVSKVPTMGLAPGTRMLSSSLIDASTLNSTAPRKSLVTGNDGVHQTMKISKSWRNKPLFRRQGDVRFKTGTEAAQLLVQEALRRDQHELEYINSVTSNMLCLSPIFDRNPKYAFVAKTLMEPERFIQFRVSWIDDTGVVRMNRGFRIQFSSSLGPYEGPLHFGSHVNDGVIKALGFDAIFSNALTGFDIGAAAGGSDFNPLDKSEAEMQRFCQSYMTELAKYVGPDMDFPHMGMGVGQEEMGYLFGQYKRINVKASVAGRYFLSGDFQEVCSRSSLCTDCILRCYSLLSCVFMEWNVSNVIAMSIILSRSLCVLWSLTSVLYTDTRLLSFSITGSWIRRRSLCQGNVGRQVGLVARKALSHYGVRKGRSLCR
jgi:hypothetical protein